MTLAHMVSWSRKVPILLGSGCCCGAILCGVLAAEESSTGKTDEVVFLRIRRIQAEALLDDASRALDQGRMDRSRESVSRVRMLAGGDAEIAVRLAALQARLDAVPVPGSADQRGAVQSQLVAKEIEIGLRHAQDALEAGQAERCLKILDQVQILLATAPVDVRQIHTVRAKELAEIAASDAQKATFAQARSIREVHQKQAMVTLADQESQVDRAYSIRLARVLELKRKRLYRIALASARRLTKDFPDRPDAKELYTQILDLSHEERRLDTEEKKIDLQEELRQQITESLIPNMRDGRPLYPEDWVTINNRSSAGQKDVVLPAWMQDLTDRLGQRIDIDADGIDGGELLQQIARRTSIPMIVEQVVQTKPFPVTLHVRAMQVDHVLDWIGRQASLPWCLHDGAVYFGSRHAQAVQTRIYDLGVLLYAPPNFEAPPMGALNASASGGGAVDIFGGGAGNQPAKAGMSSEDLIQMIRTTVAPEQWEIPGQSLALHGKSRLLVTGSPEVHLLVRQFLAAQSRAFQTLVHIESRWLDISDHYFEEIGVDWSNLGGFINDPFLNSAAGYVSASDTRSYAAKLINDLPGTAANISPALVGCGLNFQLSILSEKHLSAIFKATEQHNQRHVVQSEEVTTISGQRALVANTRQTAYISGYDVSGQAGQGINFDPTIGTVNTGTIIGVVPYVSADKKRITMELKPQYVDATFFKDEIRSPTTYTLGTDEDGVAITTSIFQSNPLELPNIRSFVAATSVSIPDGGSLLFGGFSRNLEQHSAARIPFLGTVPFLGRLFGKRGSYSERTIGSLLVTARIVLLEEEETFQ